MITLVTNRITVCMVTKFTRVPVVTIFGSIPITLQRCFALWVFFLIRPTHIIIHAVGQLFVCTLCFDCSLL